MGRSLTADEIEAIRAAAAEGLSMSKAAIALGRARSALTRTAKKHGIVFRDARGDNMAALSAKIAAQDAKLGPALLQLKRAGLSKSDTMRELRIGEERFKRLCKQFGVTYRARPTSRPQTKPFSPALGRIGWGAPHQAGPSVEADAAMHLARHGFRPVYRADIARLHKSVNFGTPAAFYRVGSKVIPTEEMMALSRSLGFPR